MIYLSGLLILGIVFYVMKQRIDRFVSGLPQPYALDARHNRILALAHPMAFHRIQEGFANRALPTAADELARQLRPLLLHFFDLRSTMDDAEIRAALNQRIHSRWFRIDLDALHPEDDPRAAMAFACARVTFAVRAAAMLGWLDEATHWQILYQNAQRASDCFASWLDYGESWARGRRQWVSRARADSLGIAFDEAQVARWVASPRHPWGSMPWQTPPFFLPRPIAG